MQLKRLHVDAGQQRDFVFEPTATRDYTIQTMGASDCKVVLFEERDGKPRYFTGRTILVKRLTRSSRSSW